MGDNCLRRGAPGVRNGRLGCGITLVVVLAKQMDGQWERMCH